MVSYTRPLRALSLLMALSLLGASGFAQEGAPDRNVPTSSISTASYALFPLEGRNLTAQLQVARTSMGETRLVLTAAGIDPNATHRAVIYEGDCGPDRPIALELAPFGLGGDPYVSTTETDEPSFATLTRGDYFVYLFRGDTIDRPDTFGLDGEALACGEVGAGANR